MIKLQNILILFLLAVSIILGIIVFTGNKSDRLKMYQQAQDSVSYYQNRLNQETAQRKTIEAEKSTLKEALTLARFDADSLKKQIGNIKTIKVIQRVGATATDTVFVEKVDTIYEKRNPIGLSFDYNGKFMQAQGKVFSDSVSLSYQYYIKGQIVTREEKRFLKKNYLVTEVVFDDPNVRTNEIQSIIVKPSVPVYQKWYVNMALGVGVGYLIFK